MCPLLDEGEVVWVHMKVHPNAQDIQSMKFYIPWIRRNGFVHFGRTFYLDTLVDNECSGVQVPSLPYFRGSKAGGLSLRFVAIEMTPMTRHSASSILNSLILPIFMRNITCVYIAHIWCMSKLPIIAKGSAFLRQIHQIRDDRLVALAMQASV